jgi:hypothetical protein
MAVEIIYECRKCFGRIVPQGDGSYGICDSCGMRVDYPKESIPLLNRANKMRARREFDQARFLYTNVTRTHPEVAEGWWGKLLCEYGVEYVEEGGQRTPTINRINYNSIYDSEDYRQALAHATKETAAVYEQDAEIIENIQKRLLELSKKEEPYDVFISFKDREDSPKRERTDDSVLAQRIFDALTDAGYKVFFSRITLRHAVGQDFEPKIFAALNSAPLMILVGCSTEHVMAPWVRNEWSRYLRLMRTNPDKHLLSVVQGMKLEQLPVELAKLEGIVAQGLSYMDDILHAVDQCVHTQKDHRVKEERERLAGGYIREETENLLREGYAFLEKKDLPKANRRFQDALELDAQLARAWWGLYLLETRNQDPAIDPKAVPEAMQAYERAISYANPQELKQFEAEENRGLQERRLYLARQRAVRTFWGLARRAATFQEEEQRLCQKTDSYISVPAAEEEWEELKLWCGLLLDSCWGAQRKSFEEHFAALQRIHEAVSGYQQEMEALEKQNQNVVNQLTTLRNRAQETAKARDSAEIKPLGLVKIIAMLLAAGVFLQQGSVASEAEMIMTWVYGAVALVLYCLILRRFLGNKRVIKQAFCEQRKLEELDGEYSKTIAAQKARIQDSVNRINKDYELAFHSVQYKGVQQVIQEFEQTI